MAAHPREDLARADAQHQMRWFFRLLAACALVEGWTSTRLVTADDDACGITVRFERPA